mmetsp:Transcript_20060/g.46542  ORF Transcript_20060/g.46542 Transcript_20060/m.46542 type:complete len:166 (+) Transcript_20060:149-646(+)
MSTLSRIINIQPFQPSQSLTAGGGSEDCWYIEIFSTCGGALYHPVFSPAACARSPGNSNVIVDVCQYELSPHFNAGLACLGGTHQGSVAHIISSLSHSSTARITPKELTPIFVYFWIRLRKREYNPSFERANRAPTKLSSKTIGLLSLRVRNDFNESTTRPCGVV